MKKRLGWISVALVFLLAGILLASCAPQQAKSERLTVMAMRPGSESYTVITGLTQVVNKHSDLELTPQPVLLTKAFVDLLRQKEADVSYANMATFATGLRGIGNYVKDGPYPDLRLLITGSNFYQGFYARGGLGIKTLVDIRGKRVVHKYTGLFEQVLCAAALMDVYGLVPGKDFVSIEASDSVAATELLRDGKADVAFGRLDAASNYELQAMVGMYSIPLDKDKVEAAIQKLEKGDPPTIGYYSVQVPAWVPGVSGPMWTMGRQAAAAVRTDFDDKVAYEIVKTILENTDELVSMGKVFEEWTWERAVTAGAARLVPYHAGAVQYYKDKGKWTAEIEAAQQQLLKEIGASR